MKYCALFAALAIAILMLALNDPKLRPLMWPAGNFLALALAYGPLGPRVLGKRPDGTRAPGAKLFFLPYTLATTATWHLVRLLSRESPVDAVWPSVTIGRRLLAHEYSYSFGLVIDLTSEFEEPPGVIDAAPGYVAFPILDGSIPCQEPLIRLVDSLANQRVYIHCAQGHGRTGLVAALLLIRNGDAATVTEALGLLKNKRPGLALSSAQLRFAETLASACVANGTPTWKSR
jgi:hypothetical protein